jgi:tetraacyldisaccharide 4'-kinase
VLEGYKTGLLHGLLRGGLATASVVYGRVVRLRNWFYDSGWVRGERALVPVVSVGNLTVGGTGKTPCVEYVARILGAVPKRVVILSRGFGGSGERNDEALVLDENLPGVPHLQGPDRARLAAAAVKEFAAEVLVLDDGFQHRRLQRDLDVVLVDATDPWGLGRLLPRGLLREPLEGLRRAGIVLLTRCDQVEPVLVDQLHEQVARLSPGKTVARTVHEPLELVNAAGESAPLSELEGRSAAAFCGIGNPQAFRRTLIGLGARIAAWRVYPDHHAYSQGDVDKLQTWAEQQPSDGIVVTTQKDLVKLRHTELGGHPLWAVRIGLRVLAGREALDRSLRDVLNAA